MAEYDIGMLRVFLLVYETGSVTTAAERLFLSQPSVSYTLRKLRAHFSDPLFVRRGTRLEPTPVAEERYPKLRRLVESMDEVMAPASAFRPETSTRRFRLRMTDVGVSGLLPRILQRVRAEAPSVVLDVESLNLATVVQDLRSGATDAAICTTRLDEPDLQRDELFTQAYAGLRPVGHPRIGERPTLPEYEAEEHVTVAISTGHTALDRHVRETGIQRRVALIVPTFAALPALLERTDLLSYAPTSVANRLVGLGQVETFALPFDVPITEIALYTVRRELPSAEFDWFRGALVEALR
ncbi:LysR family transcriptional regulator [Microbacterium gallinarum]|uniref:LysR family transcriptional regulator n=1 Tax=Microbacterium gallinarum TaxID=2762209 RepID=A0ABR8X1H8_9MICO|nr:LysR family transcriptional regulator [Microbacterium gallinarum]MBD8022751.1 LysR family transcriptional regulator [Microbacterium gallinarum]